MDRRTKYLDITSMMFAYHLTKEQRDGTCKFCNSGTGTPYGLILLEDSLGAQRQLVACLKCFMTLRTFKAHYGYHHIPQCLSRGAYTRYGEPR